MNLTDNFTLEEFTRSDMARERGIDNTPPPEVVANLRRLAEFMEKVRHILGDAPVRITSGYRCHDLNVAVGGVPNSAHLDGLACDFVCAEAGMPLAVCARLRGTPGLEFDQLINEANQYGHRWTHIGIAAEGKEPRGEVWTVDAGGTRPGL